MPRASKKARKTFPVRMRALVVRNQLRIILFCAAAILSIPILFTGIRTAPIEYDSAYLMQAPLNMAHGHGYASFGALNNGGNNELFDPYITTGPTVLLPEALLFKIFGTSMLGPRLYMAAIILAFLAVLIYLSTRRGTWRRQVVVAGISTLLFLITIDHITTFLVASDPIGEIPATLFLILAGITLYKKRYIWSGVLLSLAILTKFLLILAVPLLVVVFAYWLYKRKVSVRSTGVFIAGLAVPQIAWEVYRLISLGSVHAYIANWKSFIYFLRIGGSGIGIPQPGAQHHLFKVLNYGEKFHVFVAGYGGPGILAAIALAVIGVMILVNWKESFKVSKNYAMLIGFVAFMALWWWFISDAYNFRHISPVAILLPALVAILLSGIRVPRLLNGLLAGALGIVLLVTYVFAAHSNVADGYPYTIHDQQLVAKVASETGKPMVHYGWWQNPEILFLNDVHSHDLTTVKTPGTLILSPTMQSVSPNDYVAARADCGQIYLQLKGYVVCNYTPPASTN